MHTIYACACGSTDLYQDAAIETNNPDRVHSYSTVTCGGGAGTTVRTTSSWR